MDNIAVSVLCVVYNHEKYLRKCLDGLVMQKTNFQYEVIIHDDASTDGSKEIIHEYEIKYPDIIQIICQTENQYSKGIKIVQTFMMPKVRGKYVAVCEGDDYWCDENKLQSQYDVMEAHPNCHFCVHKVALIQEDGTRMGCYYPKFEIEGGILSTDKFMKILGLGYPFQTSSYFRRTEDLMEYVRHPPKFVQLSDVGDEPALMYFGSLGEVFYIDEVMSCYRWNSGGSWSSQQKEHQGKRLEHYKCMVAMCDAFNEWTDNKYKELLEPKRSDCYLNQFLLALDNRENARYLLRKEKRRLLNRVSIKGWIYIALKAYAPRWMARFYDRMK